MILGMIAQRLVIITSINMISAQKKSTHSTHSRLKQIEISNQNGRDLAIILGLKSSIEARIVTLVGFGSTIQKDLETGLIQATQLCFMSILKWETISHFLRKTTADFSWKQFKMPENKGMTPYKLPNEMRIRYSNLRYQISDFNNFKIIYQIK